MMIKCTFAPVFTSKLVQCSVLFCNLDPKLFLYSVLCSAEQNTTVLEHVCCVLLSLKLDLKSSSTRDHNFREIQWTKISFDCTYHHIFVKWAENFTPVLISVHKAFLRIGIRQNMEHFKLFSSYNLPNELWLAGFTLRIFHPIRS